MKKFYYLFGAVAVIGIGVVGYNVGSGVLSTAATAPVQVSFESDEELVEVAQGMAMGDEDAPVTIVEFGDYQCPGCGAFALTVKPQIDGTLVQSGRAKFVYYDFPIVSGHPNAFFAARGRGRRGRGRVRLLPQQRPARRGGIGEPGARRAHGGEQHSHRLRQRERERAQDEPGRLPEHPPAARGDDRAGRLELRIPSSWPRQSACSR